MNIKDNTQNRTLVIGDIHGCVKHLEKLLNLTNYNQQHDKLIFLGDYIDRGDYSKEVLDLLIDLKKLSPSNIFLMGNHEDMMLSNILDDGRHTKSIWISNGSDATMKSFKLSLYYNLNKIEPVYIDFLKSLKQIYIDENLKMIFAHAGVDPRRPPHEQDLLDKYIGPMWIRIDFHNNKNPAGHYKVIFGHTPVYQIKPDHYNVYIDNNKIAIDTGLIYGYKLSALEIINKEIHKVYYVNFDFSTDIEHLN